MRGQRAMLGQEIIERRSSGVLLHPTSLASPHGVGDLGGEARAFIDVLAAADQTWWQMLPVTAPASSESPYECLSMFAGNPLLIDLRQLLEDGFLTAADLASVNTTSDRVDFASVRATKLPLIERAFARFKVQSAGREDLRSEYDAFLRRNHRWLDDFALFAALRDAQRRPWIEWDPALRDRDAGTLKRARVEHEAAIDRHKFAQWLFERQWSALKRYADDRRISLLGTLPLFVALDSADVWTQPEHFLLDAQRRPRVVSGVPPDNFNKDGALWGDALYNWDSLEDRDYEWWVDRLRAIFARFDAARIDRFVGFHRAWHIPAGSTSPTRGEWVPGPRARFFKRVTKQLGELPIFAEDLGAQLPEVWELRDRFKLPGMRVLQFGFGGEPTNEHLPHTYSRRLVAYTSTHDQDTLIGWFRDLTRKAEAGGPNAALARHVKTHFVDYVGARDTDALHWAAIRLVMLSAATTTIFPLQDVLGLGSEARTSTPGAHGSSWSWRIPAGRLDDGVVAELSRLTRMFGRQTRRN